MNTREKPPTLVVLECLNLYSTCIFDWLYYRRVFKKSKLRRKDPEVRVWVGGCTAAC